MIFSRLAPPFRREGIHTNYINLDVQIQFVKTFLLKESLTSGTKESLTSGTVYHPQSAFLLFLHSRDHWRILILRPIWNVLCRPAAIFVCFSWFYDLTLFYLFQLPCYSRVCVFSLGRLPKCSMSLVCLANCMFVSNLCTMFLLANKWWWWSVSYTHLTLPTNREV